MVQNFRKYWALTGVAIFVVCGLWMVGSGAAQVPDIQPTSKPKPKSKPPANTTPPADTSGNASTPVAPAAPVPDSITNPNPKPGAGTAPNALTVPDSLTAPATQPKNKPAPGQLAVKDASGPDTDEISPAGEPIRIRVQNVIVPVSVFDPDGQIMNALQPSQFRLFDNGVEQDIHVEAEAEPLSLVIAIEASYRDDAVLKQIHKIGTLVEPLLTGTEGDCAVIAFDHNIRTLQDFTTDPQKIKDAIAKITSGSTSSRAIDAVDQAAIMLRRHDRDRNRRRVILMISETRDKGSYAHGRETLIALQLLNISFYNVDISQIVRRLTEQPEPPRPDPLPPAAYGLDRGGDTPLQVQQATGWGNSVEFMPALQEIYTDAKAIFKTNPIRLFAQGTGGEHISFKTQRGLEDAIQQIGLQIHSQYILAYQPKDETRLQGGFHQIQVSVDYPRAKVRTRPGYWLAPSN